MVILSSIPMINSFGIDNSNLPKIKAPAVTSTTITFNNNTGNVNNSEYWGTHSYYNASTYTDNNFVPYTGATKNVDLNGRSLSTEGYIGTDGYTNFWGSSFLAEYYRDNDYWKLGAFIIATKGFMSNLFGDDSGKSNFTYNDASQNWVFQNGIAADNYSAQDTTVGLASYNNSNEKWITPKDWDFSGKNLWNINRFVNSDGNPILDLANRALYNLQGTKIMDWLGNATYFYTAIDSTGSVNAPNLCYKDPVDGTLNCKQKMPSSYKDFAEYTLDEYNSTGEFIYNKTGLGSVALWAFENNGFTDELHAYANLTCTVCPIISSDGILNNFSANFTGMWIGQETLINLDGTFNGTFKDPRTFTIAGWFYTTGTAYTSFFGWSTLPRMKEFNDRIGFTPQLNNINGAGDVETPVGLTTNDTWYHFAVTYNTTNVILYINGTEYVNTYYDNGYMPTAGSLFRLGGTGFDQWFQGGFDEWRIYNRSLSATEIQNLYYLGNVHNTTVSVISANGTYNFNNTHVIVGNLTVKGAIVGNGSLLTGVCLSNGANCAGSSGTYNATYEEYSYNQSTSFFDWVGSFLYNYNATTQFANWLSGFLYNYNATAPAMKYEYNQTAPILYNYNQTNVGTYAYNMTVGSSAMVNNGTLLDITNITGFVYNYNTTVYGKYNYNQSDGAGNMTFNQSLTDAKYVNKAGDTMTGDLAINKSAATLTWQTPTSPNKAICYRTGDSTDTFACNNSGGAEAANIGLRITNKTDSQNVAKPIDFAANAKYNSTTGAISLWFNTTGTTYIQSLVTWKYPGASYYIDIEQGSNGNFRIFQNTINPTIYYYTIGVGPATACDDGAWHHFVASENATFWTIYIDGVAYIPTVNGGTWAGGYTSNVSGGAPTLRVGGYGATISVYDFNGVIDELMIFNRSITQAEVNALYNSGTGLYGNNTLGGTMGLVGGWHLDEGSGNASADFSGNGNSGYNASSTLWWAPGKVPSADTRITKNIFKSYYDSAANRMINVWSDTIAQTILDGINYIFKVSGTTKATADSAGWTWYDNFKLLFGDAGDASVYYNGSDLIENPAEVGAGKKYTLGNSVITGNLSIGSNYLNYNGSCLIAKGTGQTGACL